MNDESAAAADGQLNCQTSFICATCHQLLALEENYLGALEHNVPPAFLFSKMEVEIEKENRFRRETDKNEHRSIKCPECDEVIGRFNNKNMNAKNNLLPDSVALYVTKLQP